MTVSNPSILLNHMAEAYPDLSRIAMEFVDNSLDDAEALLVREEKEGAGEQDADSGPRPRFLHACERHSALVSALGFVVRGNAADDLATHG